MFSTFLQFEDDRVGRWATDARLRRSMQSCLGQGSEGGTSENFWAMYWHKQWLAKQDGTDQASGGKAHSSSLALASISLGHLSAYLQEACYWNAQKVTARLEGAQYRLSDGFQVAIAAVPRILRAFDSSQLPSLKTYASSAFGNIIRDELRQRREVNRCNEWGLLLRISRKQLREALENAGLGADEIEQYLLAWASFSALYIPKKSPGLRQLAAPEREVWQAIAHHYNQQRVHLTIPDPNEAKPETLERWLVGCAKRLRAYLYPTVTSLNTPRLGQESGEIQDDVPDPGGDSLLSDLIAEEENQTRQTQRRELSVVLKQAIADLDPALQELLQLYYQQELSQQQIARQLNLQQYAVSRKLTKARELLLKALAQWGQETLHISATSNVVKGISATLEEWLQAYYQASGGSG
jgi:RNA polymerase sigma factor (sigma-70 family)